VPQITFAALRHGLANFVEKVRVEKVI
jgi:hypothetical protein